MLKTYILYRNAFVGCVFCRFCRFSIFSPTTRKRYVQESSGAAISRGTSAGAAIGRGFPYRRERPSVEVPQRELPSVEVPLQGRPSTVEVPQHSTHKTCFFSPAYGKTTARCCVIRYFSLPLCIESTLNSSDFLLNIS